MHSYLQEIKPHLSEKIAAYRQLERERQLGWESDEVDKIWKMRSERLGSETQRKEGRGPGFAKYRDFYAKTLPVIDSQIFSSSSPKFFLDCGCAPGGLVAFFVKDLGWSGHGLSLDPENGGLEMRFRPPQETFTFSSMSFTSLTFDAEIAKVVETLPGRVDFLNLGVVIGGHQVVDDESTSLQMLTVCRNSFCLMFSILNPKGDLLWIFPSTNAGAWLYFLDKLRKVFPGGISLFLSLVPSRSPVYALCRGFNPDAVRDWEAELRANPHPGRASIDAWNLKTWAQAESVVSALLPDLEIVWTKQTDSLRQIRLDASALVDRPEAAFTKLSGGFNGGKKNASRADNDLNWRR